uniref:Insc_C domain-containing protein n=1 Tax=Parastrongyloides trichosuri TaxID=131310 RepID=A0A0N4ZBD2_PARTI
MDNVEPFIKCLELIYSQQTFLNSLTNVCEIDVQSILFSRSSFDIDNETYEDVKKDNLSNDPNHFLLNNSLKQKKCIARLTSSLQKVVSTSSTEINILTNDDKNKGFTNKFDHINNKKNDNFSTSLKNYSNIITNDNYKMKNENIAKNLTTPNFDNGPVAIYYTSRNNTPDNVNLSSDKRFNHLEFYEKKTKKDNRSNQKGYYLRLRGSTPNLSGIVEEEDADEIETSPFMRSYDNCINFKHSRNAARKPVIRARINSINGTNKANNYNESLSKTYHHLIPVNNNSNLESYSTTDANSVSSITTEITPEMYVSSNSPKSIYSTRSSTDSGQESTETDCHQKSTCKRNSYKYSIKYQQIYIIIDSILKLGSKIYSSLTYIIDNRYVCQNLLIETKELITLFKNRYLITTINHEDVQLIQELLIDVEKELIENGDNRIFSNYFIIILRRTIEEAFHCFTKIICEYFINSSHDDKLLHIATEHFIYLLLFSDELCNVAIQYQLVKKLLQFCSNPITKHQTTKLLLRAMAVLCSASKGCTQLFENNGSTFIINVICHYPFDCAVEAAGVLTQLTSPSVNYITSLKNISPIIIKLTEMTECCDSAESLLLCTAALSNLTIQYSSANRYIHEIKTCQKLVLATKKPKCCSIFVYEQMVTLMARMASQGWYITLYNKECVEFLLKLMLISDEFHPKYCERIHYKSAVALSSIAKNDYGLQLIKQNNGYGIMCKITESNLNNTEDPMVIICQTIRDRLENEFNDYKYLETAL